MILLFKCLLNSKVFCATTGVLENRTLKYIIANQPFLQQTLFKNIECTIIFLFRLQRFLLAKAQFNPISQNLKASLNN